jgi:hypothetical protein
MERLLWRLDGTSAASPSPERLAEGLRLHLEHSDLITILVQIGEAQQAYISALGCDSCHLGRHAPGCHIELLRRLLVATFAAVELVPIPQGLARRPYTQAVLARPSRQSTPFDGADLAGWDEARVMLHWQRGARGLTTAALVAVGDGPDPAAFLHERGWSARPLPKGIGQRVANNPVPVAVWFRWIWPGAPFLLTPQPLRVPLARAEAPTEELATNTA